MTYLRKAWQLHTAAGAVPILEGTFGFDRAWAPQGAGTVDLPMDHPGTAAIVANDRQPLLLVCDLWHTVPAGTLAGAFTGTRLGDAAWPDEPVTTYPGTMLDAIGTPIVHRRRAWHCWPRPVSRNTGGNTITVQLATVELLLVEAMNLGDPWLPAPTGPGATYLLSDVLLELTRYLGIPLGVEASDAAVDLRLVEPWGRGESAWDWFEGLRAAAFRSYRYDPALNRLRFVAATDAALGTVAPDYLEHTEVLGGATAQDGMRYADALLLTWTWTDAAGTERQHVDVALAPGVPSWKAARKPLSLERRGRPQAGIAQHIVNQLARWRTTATAVTALEVATLVDLGEGRGATAQAISFALGDEPTVTFTIITEE